MDRIAVHILFVPLLLASCGEGAPAPEDDAPIVEQVVEVRASPGRYTGVLPCADCAGIGTELQLWPSGACVLQSTYQGKPVEANRFVEWGRWSHDDPGRVVLELEGGERTLYFAPQPDGSLVKYDLAGTTLLEAATNSLAATEGTFAPGGVLPLRGAFYYPQPRVAHFRECDSGRDLLVRLDPQAAGIEGDFRDLGGDPAQGLVAEVKGTLQVTPLEDADGTVLLLTIKEYDALLPEERCAW